MGTGGWGRAGTHHILHTEVLSIPHPTWLQVSEVQKLKAATVHQHGAICTLTAISAYFSSPLRGEIWRRQERTFPPNTKYWGYGRWVLLHHRDRTPVETEHPQGFQWHFLASWTGWLSNLKSLNSSRYAEELRPCCKPYGVMTSQWGSQHA